MRLLMNLLAVSMLFGCGPARTNSDKELGEAKPPRIQDLTPATMTQGRQFLFQRNYFHPEAVECFWIRIDQRDSNKIRYTEFKYDSEDGCGGYFEGDAVEFEVNLNDGRYRVIGELPEERDVIRYFFTGASSNSVRHDGQIQVGEQVFRTLEFVSSASQAASFRQYVADSPIAGVLGLEVYRVRPLGGPQNYRQQLLDYLD